jgi:hypothetical protein
MEQAMSKLELAKIAWALVREIVDAVTDANADRITPDEALTRVRLAAKGPTLIDARVDAAARARFDDDGGPPPRNVKEALKK